MNETLKAVILEVSGGNVRDHHINLLGILGLFPDDSLGGSNHAEVAKQIVLHIGGETVETDIDEKKAIFRESGALCRFFADHAVNQGDLVLVERLSAREFQISKISKRGFSYHL